MPPNLGGFFMVRSYYPSECHADYFDFERIEALKPAIEACGISTLDRKSGSAGMPRPISYAVFCLKKKSLYRQLSEPLHHAAGARQRGCLSRHLRRYALHQHDRGLPFPVITNRSAFCRISAAIFFFY